MCSRDPGILNAGIVEQTAGPALCLLRSAVLDGGFLRDLIAEPDALRTVISNLASQVYTTVTPRLMALATLSNLYVQASRALFHLLMLCGRCSRNAQLRHVRRRNIHDHVRGTLVASYRCGLGRCVCRGAVQAVEAAPSASRCACTALASDNRVQVRQLGAALLHNTVLKLDPLVEGRLSDALGLVLCSLCESVDDADEEATRRRLLAIGRLVSRAGDAAGELVYAAECVGVVHALPGIHTLPVAVDVQATSLHRRHHHQRRVLGGLAGASSRGGCPGQGPWCNW